MNADYLKRDNIKKYVCNMEQIAGITKSILDDGGSRGVRIAQVDNGSGLRFTVIPDRGMDIGAASYCGVPLAWLSPLSIIHPAYYDSSGIEWLRSWGGGLLTGCGMVNVGEPAPNSNGVEGGLHGRLSNIPAENCIYKSEWCDDEYILSVSGEMREAHIFGENLLLRRGIKSVMGKNTIEVKDVVKNEGCRSTPLMLLYHINIGYPMIDKDCVLKAEDHSVALRDAEAEKGLGEWDQLNPPDANFAEQCYYHDLVEDSNGMAQISVINKKLNMELDITYRKAELPFFTQWKMMGEGEYAMGLEPANCHPEGQIAEAEKFNSLKILEPGESLETFIKFTIKELA